MIVTKCMLLALVFSISFEGNIFFVFSCSATFHAQCPFPDLGLQGSCVFYIVHGFYFREINAIM
uniref:Uncharacterized protein n=1 Tax=Arundo donax TaxID=35708 RepID=A0A0A9FKZ3_ARUDO